MWDLSVAVTRWLGDARDELLVRGSEPGSAAAGARVCCFHANLCTPQAFAVAWRICAYGNVGWSFPSASYPSGTYACSRVESWKGGRQTIVVFVLRRQGHSTGLP